jgi:hypothetical protein
VSVAQGALRVTAQRLQQELGASAVWRGYTVNLFDRSTLQLADTPELTEQYGTATNQHRAGHWLLMRLVAGFDLWSGAAHGVTEGAYCTSEQVLAIQLIRSLGAGFLHVGDRNFGVYALLPAI